MNKQSDRDAANQTHINQQSDQSRNAAHGQPIKTIKQPAITSSKTFNPSKQVNQRSLSQQSAKQSSNQLVKQSFKPTLLSANQPIKTINHPKQANTTNQTSNQATNQTHNETTT